MRKNFDTILAIGAHPDDIEFGCLGFLLSQKKKGSQIHSLVLTSGENGNNGDGNARREEQEKAFNCACFDSLSFGPFRDGEIAFNSHTISFVENLINKVKPDLVLTHFPNDWHQDHTNTANAVRAACRNVPKLWYFRSYSAVDFSPMIYSDISDEIVQKENILDLFQTQIEKNLKKGIDFKQIALDTNRYFGNDVGVKFAEAFSIYRYLL